MSGVMRLAAIVIVLVFIGFVVALFWKVLPTFKKKEPPKPE